MDKRRLIIYPLLFIITLAIATLGFSQFGFDGLILSMGITFLYFTIIFLIATAIKNNSIVDIGWGMGFVIGSWVTFFITDEPTILSYIVLGFITFWGLRLSIRLLRRNYGKPEDFRYRQWREEWGEHVVLIAFFRVFMVQGIINFVVGSAGYAIIKFNTFNGEGMSQWVVYLGLIIAFTGLFFEVVGDEQLRRHIKEGTRTLLQSGLWSVTRHPNYFGEILIWIGLYIAGTAMLIDQSIPLVFYLSLILSPVIMSTVLIKISTPLLEKNMEKYDGWEDYKKRVPMIFPWAK